MPGGNKNIKPSDNPKPFTKGNNANPNGRPKKIYTIIKEMGYSVQDLKSAFAELTWYSIKELQALHKDDSKPIIVRIVANQLYLALKNGDMAKIKEIMEYTLGKPTQTTDINVQGEQNIPPPVIQVLTLKSVPKLSENENDIEE